MKEYRLSEEDAKKAMKSQIISRIPMMLVAGFAGLYIADSQSKGRIFNDSFVLLLIIPMIAISMTVGLILGNKNGTKALMQNIYRLTDSSIERTTPSGKVIRIDFEKIETNKSLKKGLEIRSKNEKILIPAELDNYNEISNLILAKVK